MPKKPEAEKDEDELDPKDLEIPEDRMDKFTWKEGDLVYLDDDGNEITAEEMKKRKQAHDASLAEMAGTKPGGGAPGGIMPEEEE